MARTIVITSGKGGVGKSSVSVNVASALAMQNYRVCLIDADFGLKNLDVMMGLENRVVYDLNDAIEGRCVIEQLLVKDKRIPGLSLIPACKSLEFKDLKLEYMQSLIENINDQFDFILIDSPAGIERGFDLATTLASEAIVVVTLDVSSLRDGDRVVGLLMKKGIQNIHMIINKVNNENIDTNKTLTIEDASDIISLPILGVVYDDVCMIEANNKGMPVYLNQKAILRPCFFNISSRILGRHIPIHKLKRKNKILKIFQSA